MPLVHIVGLFFDAPATWKRIHERQYSTGAVFFMHTALLALVPAICGYFGTTQVGWEIGPNIHKLTASSAAGIALAYYLAMLGGALSVAWMTRWMSETYGASQPFSQCLALASMAATPLFLVGALQSYPVLWINLLAGLPALGFTVYLVYTGVPIVMEVPPERGFLFSSAVMGFWLVALVALLVITVLLWGSGFAPAFTIASP